MSLLLLKHVFLLLHNVNIIAVCVLRRRQKKEDILLVNKHYPDLFLVYGNMHMV